MASSKVLQLRFVVKISRNADERREATLFSVKNIGVTNENRKKCLARGQRQNHESRDNASWNHMRRRFWHQRGYNTYQSEHHEEGSLNVVRPDRGTIMEGGADGGVDLDPMPVLETKT